MKRRDFIAGLGGAALVGARGAWGQQPAMPVIGFLNGSVATSIAPAVAAFRAGLSETDFVDGRNLAIEFRWAEGDYQRLPAMAADLITRRVAVIVAGGTAAAAKAAKAATTTI